MSFVIDTCAWIEWFVNGKLATEVSQYLEVPEKILVPSIIQFELYKWACREKDETTALEIIGIIEQAHVISIDTTLALFAADCAKQHKLAAIDALVYASSQLHKANLITCDKHFKNLTGVIYFAK